MGGKLNLETVSGDTITVQINGDDLWIFDETGKAGKITIADVNQSNGVIHVIDRVLLAEIVEPGSTGARLPNGFLPGAPGHPGSRLGGAGVPRRASVVDPGRLPCPATVCWQSGLRSGEIGHGFTAEQSRLSLSCSSSQHCIAVTASGAGRSAQQARLRTVAALAAPVRRPRPSWGPRPFVRGCHPLAAPAAQPVPVERPWCVSSGSSRSSRFRGMGAGGIRPCQPGHRPGRCRRHPLCDLL